MVIKELNLDTTATLNIRVRQLSPTESDEHYFKTVIKDTTRKFAIITYDSLGNKQLSKIAPDKNLFDLKDINYFKVH